jgi:hypothetical protein
MRTITTAHDYRIIYEMLMWYEQKVRESSDVSEYVRERIIEMKRALRKYANRPAGLVDVGMGFMCERRIIKDGGMDGYTELVSIPEVFDTLEDTEDGPGAESFFRDFFYREVRPSMYDCTGQSFTCWYKLFKRNGQFWAYHSVGFDV